MLSEWETGVNNREESEGEEAAHAERAGKGSARCSPVKHTMDVSDLTLHGCLLHLRLTEHCTEERLEAPHQSWRWNSALRPDWPAAAFAPALLSVGPWATEVSCRTWAREQLCHFRTETSQIHSELSRLLQQLQQSSLSSLIYLIMFYNPLNIQMLMNTRAKTTKNKP